MTRLANHHALVTGGGSGIGAAIARALAAEGVKITLVGRRREKLEEIATELPEAFAAPADVTDRAQVDAAFAAAREAQGPLTILINCAGEAHVTRFQRMKMETWRQSMAVNLDAVVHCCQAALPDLLRAESARIITIASIAGLKGGMLVTPYVASKHGAVGLMRAMSIEFARTRLTVNAVCPSYSDTEVVRKAVADIRRKSGRSEEQILEGLTATNPQRRLIDPVEVAATVVWLCLPESRSVNGQAISISGGE